MAGARRPQTRRRELSGSWADVSSEDEQATDSGESLEIDEGEDEPHSPARSIEVVQKEDHPSAELRTERASKRRSNDENPELSPPPQYDSPRTPSTSGARRSTRLGSRQNSREPDLIMPSILASGSLKPSSSKSSPLSNSLRTRKSRPSGGSRMTPSRGVRNTPKPPSPKLSKQPKSNGRTSAIPWMWSQIVQPMLQYALGVIGYAMVHLKPLFGILVAIFAVFWGCKLAFQSVFGSLSVLPDLTKLVPSPCSIPILNMLPACGQSFAPGAAPEFEDLMTVQSSFEDILQSTAQGSVLPLEMKRSEASIRDLKYVVTYSNLPSKGELVYEFQGFIDVARQAAGDLTKFNSKVGRAVDHIISTNKHTLKVIDGFVDSEASRGALSKWLWSSTGLTQEHLLRQYLQHTGQVEEEIQRLIIEATVLLKILEDLDGRLDIIHGIITRDGVHVKDSRDELFAQLWTKLGGNRNSVQKLNNQMQLLKSVNTYRKAAWSHVTATLLKLQAISTGLEDLRERVALPETVGVEFVPLSQHIETIQLGVERLERVRESSRGLEMEGQRKILDQGGVAGKDRMVEGQAKFVS